MIYNASKIGLITLAGLIFLSGCAKVTTLPSKQAQEVINISSDMLQIGDKITFEMPFDNDDPYYMVSVKNEALKKSGYDLILAPRYYTTKKFGKSRTITITGRGANFKNPSK